MPFELFRGAGLDFWPIFRTGSSWLCLPTDCAIFILDPETCFGFDSFLFCTCSLLHGTVLMAADSHQATPLILLEHNDDHLTSLFFNLSSFFSIMLFCSCISGRSSFIMPVKDTTEGKTACTLMIGALSKHLIQTSNPFTKIKFTQNKFRTVRLTV